MITCINLVKMGMFGTLLTGVLSCLCWVGESQQPGGQPQCSIYRAVQCADHDGPGMHPDMVDFHDVSCWPAVDRAWEYNRRLASSNSAQIGGRHYAAGCLYSSRLPSDCLVIDHEVGDTPHANWWVHASQIGSDDQAIANSRGTAAVRM